MSNLEAHSLIIKSMSMLEDVINEYNETFEPKFFPELDKIVEDFVKLQEWTGSYNILEKGIEFAPDRWKIDNTEDSVKLASYFVVSVKDNIETNWGNEYTFFLSQFLGIGATQSGFSFEVERKYIGNPKLGEWKKFCQNHPLYTEIGTKGFYYLNSGSWFIPFKIDSDNLAESYCAGNTVDALQPVSEALDKIKDAHHLFDQVLADAKANNWGCNNLAASC